MLKEPAASSRLENPTRSHREPLKALVKQPFRTRGLDLGVSRVGSLDDVEGVLAHVEGDAHS